MTPDNGAFEQRDTLDLDGLFTTLLRLRFPDGQRLEIRDLSTSEVMALLPEMARGLATRPEEQGNLVTARTLALLAEGDPQRAQELALRVPTPYLARLRNWICGPNVTEYVIPEPAVIGSVTLPGLGEVAVKIATVGRYVEVLGDCYRWCVERWPDRYGPAAPATMPAGDEVEEHYRGTARVGGITLDYDRLGLPTEEDEALFRGFRQNLPVSVSRLMYTACWLDGVAWAEMERLPSRIVERVVSYSDQAASEYMAWLDENEVQNRPPERIPPKGKGRGRGPGSAR